MLRPHDLVPTAMRGPGPNAARARAVAAATLLPVLVWVLAVPVAGVDLEVPDGDGTRTIGLGAVVVTAAGVSLAGWVLLEVLERVVRGGWFVWWAISMVVLIGSFAPLGDPDMSTATAVVFALMRLVMAAVLMPTFVSTARRRLVPPAATGERPRVAAGGVSRA
ncbi:MAG: DUF6069 family protein [Actinomycetota bacterium]|nr:DUF6069 family protein [Actinomycetota bacterium]